MALFFKRHFGVTKWSDGLACLVCLTKYKIFAEFKRHIRCKEHQKKMSQVFYSDDHSISGKIPQIIVMDGSVQIPQPHLGLQMLTVCISLGIDQVLYLCHICEELVLDHRILEHIGSSSHEYNYYYTSSDKNTIKPRRYLNVNGVGPLQILSLPPRLLSKYECYSYFQVMTSLSDYEALPSQLRDLMPERVINKEPQGEVNKENQEDPQKNLPSLNATEKPYKIQCQNCNIQFDSAKQYYEHVQNEEHKTTVKSISSHGKVHSASDTEEKQNCDQKAAVAESLTLQQDILNQLDKHPVPALSMMASMMVFCQSSEAASKVVCICCACQRAFPFWMMIKHLSAHSHLLQILLHLNPWRLPFGWKQVPERRFLQSEVEAEEKERGWSQVVIKVMDLPSSVFNSINPPSYLKVMDQLVRDFFVLKRNVPPCQTFSRLHEQNTYPLLGCNFIASHESHHAARHTPYESLLCLLCRRRVTDQESYAHAFSWEHVAMFLDRFHPGSPTVNCDTKVLLDLAVQAARIHSVTHIQKIKLDKPIEEPCDYAKVKKILSSAKKKDSKNLFIPLIQAQAPLVLKETATSSNSGSKMTSSLSKNTSENPTDSNGTSHPQKTLTETGQQRTGHILMPANGEGEQKRPREAQVDEIPCKRQKRNSRDMAPCEEKPKIKREYSEQLATPTTSGATCTESASKTSTVYTTSTHVTTMVARSKFTASKPTTTTEKIRATTTTPSPNGSTQSTAHTNCYAPVSCRVTTTEMYSSTTKSTASASCNTKPHSVTSPSVGATATTAKSTAPSPSSYQFCKASSSSAAPGTNRITSPTLCPTKSNEATAVTPRGTASTIKSTAPAISCATTSPGFSSITKTTAPNMAHGATITSCAAPTFKVTASNSGLKPSATTSPAQPKGSKDATESKLAQPAFRRNSETVFKTLPSSKTVKNTEPLSRCHSYDARYASSTDNRLHSRSKPVFSKVGLSSIVVVSSEGRKQSYCTLCHIKLERSSHHMEYIHLHNYMKWRFPELNAEQLAAINLKRFAWSMTEVEMCLGLSNIQTLEVTNDEYNELANLSEAQALHRLETHFQVSFCSLEPLGQHVPMISWQGASSPEDAFDTEAHASSAAELEATIQSTNGFKCVKDISESVKDITERQSIDDPDLKLAEEILEDFEPSPSVLVGPEPQTVDSQLKDPETNLKHSKPPSLVLTGPDPKIGESSSNDMEDNLPDSGEPSPSTSLGQKPQIDDQDLNDAEKHLEGEQLSKDVEKHLKGDQDLKDAEKNLKADQDLKDAEKHLKGDQDFKYVKKHLEGDQDLKDAEKHLKSDQDLKDAKKHLKGDQDFNYVKKHLEGDQDLNDVEKHLEGDQDFKGVEKRLEGEQHLKDVEKHLEGNQDLKEDKHLEGEQDLEDIEKHLEGSNRPSPTGSLLPDPHIANSCLNRHLEGSNRSSALTLPGKEPTPASVNSGPQNPNLFEKCKDDRWSNTSVCQAPLFAGSSSNVKMFLWVKGVSHQPIIGLASVYECRGTHENSFYLCESCGMKLTVGDICQHMGSVKHQLTYLIKAYPQFMDTFWYEDDLNEELKLNILNEVAVNIAAQEHAKKMDAKVLYLFQDLYDYVLNAPFEEALSKLQSLTCQSDGRSHQTASQTFEKRGHDKDSNANSVSSTSSANASLIPQEKRKGVCVSPQSSDFCPVSRKSPAIQAKDEAIRSHCSAPPVFQVKSEPMPSETTPPVRLGRINKASLQAHAELLPREHGTAQAISQEQPSFHVMVRPSGSESGANACPISEVQPSYKVKPELKLPESASGANPCPISEEHSSFNMKGELNPPESGSGATVGTISEEKLHSFQVKTEPKPPESESLNTGGLISEKQPSFPVKVEIMAQGSQSLETSTSVSKEQPNIQLKAKLMTPKSQSLETLGPVSEELLNITMEADGMPQDSSSPEGASPVFVEAPTFQVKPELIPQKYDSPKTDCSILEERPGYKTSTSALTHSSILKTPLKTELLLPCGSTVTPGLSSGTVASSQFKDEILLMEHRPSVSTDSISKTQPSSQVKDDSMRSAECIPHVATTPSIKLPSSCQVKDQLHSENVAADRSIRQDEYLPTRKRPALESLDELIRICTKTKLNDARSIKSRRKSEACLAKSSNGNPVITPANQSHCDQGAPVTETRHPGSKTSPAKEVDSIAATASTRVGHLTSVQPSTATAMSNNNLDLKSCKISPATTPGLQRVMPDHLSHSSSQNSVIVTVEKSTNTVLPRDTDWPEDNSDLKPLLDVIDLTVSHEKKVSQGNENTYKQQMQIPVVTSGLLSNGAYRISAAGTRVGSSEAQSSNTGSSGPGRQIPCVSNLYSRYAQVMPAVSYRAQSSLPPGNTNVGQSSSVQFFFQQETNPYTVPVGRPCQTMIGWTNQHTQQWVSPQQQQPQQPQKQQQQHQHQHQHQTTWVQTAGNVTNGTYLYSVPLTANAYYGSPVSLVPVNTLTLAQFSQSK